MGKSSVKVHKCWIYPGEFEKNDVVNPITMGGKVLLLGCHMLPHYTHLLNVSFYMKETPLNVACLFLIWWRQWRSTLRTDPFRFRHLKTKGVPQTTEHLSSIADCWCSAAHHWTAFADALATEFWQILRIQQFQTMQGLRQRHTGISHT